MTPADDTRGRDERVLVLASPLVVLVHIMSTHHIAVLLVSCREGMLYVRRLIFAD